jgi:hypothetical protein
MWTRKMTEKNLWNSLFFENINKIELTLVWLGKYKDSNKIIKERRDIQLTS